MLFFVCAFLRVSVQQVKPFLNILKKRELELSRADQFLKNDAKGWHKFY